MDGVLVIDKPVGPTSHDIVVLARRVLGDRRVGHTGTLDPLAAGVLPLVVGRATRLAPFLSAADKVYEAEIVLGVESDTFDRAGHPRPPGDRNPLEVTRDDLECALNNFRGTFRQAPPAFSAKRIDGARAYALARRDRSAVAPPAVEVTAHELCVLAFSPPWLRLRVRCAAGFYVRSLAHDLGAALGTGARLEELTRTRSGEFRREAAVSVETLADGAAADFLMPLSALLPDLPAVVLTDSGVRRARHGNVVGMADLSRPPSGLKGWVRLFSPRGELIALARPQEGAAALHPAIVLM